MTSLLVISGKNRFGTNFTHTLGLQNIFDSRISVYFVKTDGNLSLTFFQNFADSQQFYSTMKGGPSTHLV